MKDQKSVITKMHFGVVLCTAAIVFSCKDDPQPVNEEELITTLIVDLTPIGGGEPLELKFFDEDGDGDIDPIITPSLAELNANTNYTAEITLLNETLSPAEDITEEVEEEMNDHLFCFTVTGSDVMVSYEDEDENGHPVGLVTEWEAGDSGTAGVIQIVLRHQPGTKNGDCPGPGDSDIQVEFPIQVVE
ncbi:MAG TPA: hypothetical protein VGK59_11800 [Ohtaekwangia sp.]